MEVPRDRLWTAKDDARYLTPLVGTRPALPAHHRRGARVALHQRPRLHPLRRVLCLHALHHTSQWKRLRSSTSPTVIVQCVEYLKSTTPHSICPPSPMDFTATPRCAADRLFHGGIRFGATRDPHRHAPLSLAVVNHFTWYAKASLGGRQSARSIRFLTLRQVSWRFWWFTSRWWS